MSPSGSPNLGVVFCTHPGQEFSRENGEFPQAEWWYDSAMTEPTSEKVDQLSVGVTASLSKPPKGKAFLG